MTKLIKSTNGIELAAKAVANRSRFVSLIAMENAQLGFHVSVNRMIEV